MKLKVQKKYNQVSQIDSVTTTDVVYSMDSTNWFKLEFFEWLIKLMNHKNYVQMTDELLLSLFACFCCQLQILLDLFCFSLYKLTCLNMYNYD